MPTGYIDPNGDIQVGWSPSPPPAHYTLINKAVRQPTAPSTATYISKTGVSPADYVADAFDMTTISTATTVSRIKIWWYGNQTGTGSNFYTNLIIGGVGIPGPTQNFSSSGYNSWSWEYTTFDGNWTQADLDSIRVDIWHANSMSETIQVAAMYGEITYSYEVIGDSLGWAFGF